MAALRKDEIIIPQGTTWAIRWPIQSLNGEPINTSGWSVRSQVRHRVASPEVLHEWSSEKGNASVFDSFVELRVAPEESSAWQWGRNPVVFDVEVLTEKQEVIRITQGTIALSPEVTR